MKKCVHYARYLTNRRKCLFCQFNSRSFWSNATETICTVSMFWLPFVHSQSLFWILVLHIPISCMRIRIMLPFQHTVADVLLAPVNKFKKSFLLIWRKKWTLFSFINYCQSFLAIVHILDMVVDDEKRLQEWSKPGGYSLKIIADITMRWKKLILCLFGSYVCFLCYFLFFDRQMEPHQLPCLGYRRWLKIARKK